MTHEIPDPINITLEQYKEGDFWIQTAYIKGLLSTPEFLLTDDQAEIMRGKNGADYMIGFSNLTGYQPKDSLTQLVQAIVCERNLTEPRTGWSSPNFRRIRSNIEDRTQHVGKRKRAIAEEIFGEQAGSYLPRLESTFFSHLDTRRENSLNSAGTQMKRRKDRKRDLKVLTEEISEAFPLTSR